MGEVRFKGHAVRSALLTPRVFLGLQHAGPHSVVLSSSSRKDLLSTRPQGHVGNVADTKSAARESAPASPTLSISTTVKAERELSVDSRAPKPAPIAQTSLLRLHASLAAARRLFPERCSPRASSPCVQRVCNLRPPPTDHAAPTQVGFVFASC